MIIPVTNEAIEIGGDVLTYSEFLVFLSIWFLMAMIISPSLEEWFSSLPLN